MPRRIRVHLTYANVTVTVLAVLVIGGGTLAVGAIPGKDGKITACYSKKTGAVRLINADKKRKCRTGERRVAWNQRGVQGVQGAQGVQGDPGQNGQNGATNVAIRSALEIEVNVKKWKEVTASCLPGERRTGGGGQNFTEGENYDDAVLVSSYPVDSPAQSWKVEVYNRGDSATPGPIHYKAWVVCAAP